MTIPGSRYEPADPTVRSPGGAGSPIRPVVGRRGLRQQAGIVAVAVVAIAVVAAGVGLGRQENEALPGPSGTPPPASAAATAASPGPSRPATPAPTELPGLGCLPVAPDDLPEFRLSSSPAVGDPVGGSRRRLVAGDPPTSAWPVPLELSALVLDPSASLVLEPDDPVCVRYTVAEYLAVGDLGKAPSQLGPGATNVNPPRSSVVLGALPAGDWVVRAVAYYSTGVAGDEDQAIVERFFRVITGLAPDATPMMTPTVACVALPADAPLPELSLMVGDGEPVPGTEPPADPAPGSDAALTATYRDRLVIGVAGDVCATSWRVQFLVSGFTRVVVNDILQENPGDNPFLVSQNRIELTSATFGRTIVSAVVSFGRSRQTTAKWDLTVTAPAPPAAEVLGPAGSRVPALTGCGASVTLADGRSAWEYCERSTVPDGLAVLRVKAGQVVRLDVPGLPIVSWWVSCGERSASDGSYVDPGNCQLGGAGDGLREVGPARFLPFPGRHIVSAWITVRRGDETISAQYFADIEVEP
jgi:hypothetical protein